MQYRTTPDFLKRKRPMRLVISDTSYLAAMSYFKSEKAVRYYLNGIHLKRLDDTTIRICATDGHRLLKIIDRDAVVPEGFTECIISLDSDQQRISRQKSNRGKSVMIDLNDGEETISIGGATFFLKLIDGKFPDVDKITPKPKDVVAPEQPLAFNGLYLADFTKACLSMGSKYCETILSQNASGGTLVEFPMLKQMSGLIMPLRT